MDVSESGKPASSARPSSTDPAVRCYERSLGTRGSVNPSQNLEINPYE
jgi:hypothetical protein